MVEPFGKAHHFQSFGWNGRITRFPADRLSDLHRWKRLCFRLFQSWLYPADIIDRQLRCVPARQDVKQGSKHHKNDEDSDQDFA